MGNDVARAKVLERRAMMAVHRGEVREAVQHSKIYQIKIINYFNIDV